MKKISIVGVEGSGKTVLMSVLGERYARPDENGLSLKAKSAETFLFCSTAVAAMRKGEWPPATQPGEMTRLEWQLLRHRGSSEPKVIGELTMLDFAGEVYRQAFGLDQNHIDESYQDDVNRLRQYVIQSDVLMVLVNLKEVIDGDRTEKRTNELLWLSQRILDFAKEHSVRDVALVVSQTDRYEHIVLECGSVQEVLKRYLANTAYAFPHVPTFAVSAVDRTIFKKNGLEGPAEDFSSSGLSELMAWIKNRIASRSFLIKGLLYFFLSLGVVAGGAFFVIREKQRIDTMTQLKTKQLAGYVIEITDLGESFAKWKEGVELPGNRNLVTLKEEGTYRAIEQGYEWVPGTLCARWVKGVPHERNKEIVSGEKEGEWITFKPGYLLTNDFSLIWKSGLQHPNCGVLKSCIKEGVWKCTKPGWEWVGGTNIEWQAGVVHPNSERLKSSSKEDCWECINPGWKWVEGTNIVWVTGIAHPENNNLISSDIPDNWVSSKPGYIVEGNSDIVWQSGLKHPQNNKLVSSSIEGQWECVDAGYKWDGETGVVWEVGLRHPNNTNLVSDEKKDAWKSIRPGYVWVNGTDTDEWRPGLTHPLNEKLKSDVKVGVWKSIEPGYVWSGNAELMWKAGIEHLLFPHVFSSETEGEWHPESGFEWYGNVASGDYSVKWVEGKIIGRRKTGKHIGEWYKLCRECEGKGKVRHRLCNGDGNVKCDRCDGGRIAYKDTEPCMECDGSGKKRCPNECVSKNKIDTDLDTSLSVFFFQRERPEKDFDYYIIPCKKSSVSENRYNGPIAISHKLYYNFNHGGRHGYHSRYINSEGYLDPEWMKCPDCNGAIAKKCPLNHVTNGRWQSNGYVDCAKCEKGVYEVEKYKDCSSCNYGRIKCNGCDDGYVNCSHCIDGWVKDSK